MIYKDVLRYYDNKQTDDLFCLTEQWNNCLWKLSVLLVYICIYSLLGKVYLKKDRTYIF